jgi:pilus assembly protein FimV
MLDFDFNLDTPEPPAAAPAAQPESVDDAFDFDMSTLDSLGSPQASEPAAPSLDGMSLSDDPLSTKLDLARVYLDMGDKEGAREVLEELAAEAQGSLKSEAETLLASL